MGTCPENILDELESYVVSCENTVTYKWVSQKWNVHVNTAKQLLYSFLDKEKSKENPLNFEVIYFLSGPVKNADEGKSYQVCLVKEKDVGKVKSQLQKVVSEHVYSIQKSSLKDLNVLYIVDKANGDEILQGKSGRSSVKCEDAVPRAADFLAPAASARGNVKDNALLDKNSLKPSTDSSTCKVDNQKGGKVNGEASLTIGKGKKDGPKGIAGMFAAAQGGKALSKKSETENENGNPKSSEIKKPSGKKVNGIASLFAKQAERPPAPKPKKKEPKKVEEPKKVIVVEDEDPFASEDEDVRKGLLTKEVTSEEERSESPVKTKVKAKAAKTKATRERKKKRAKHSDGEEESPLAIKKRRRIKMMSSSEGSSEDEEMEVGEPESPIPSTVKKSMKEAVSDDEDIIPATPQESQGGPAAKKRMRKRVLVNRTFSDDQGFIVTKKEYIFESCTDDSSQSGDEAKSSKEKVIPNGKLNHTDKDNSEATSKKSEGSDMDKDDLNSPVEEKKDSKGRKSKDTAKGKKPAGKKISPPTGRQGVLTSFFKRS
ncbi:DNA polymerase delta subunit 3-like [Hetaerina americana]|uniref:DNA polymerase delta subunit 3-like n=1 Tax=Hetaerina americana TaxID=62018 RepID=UPI003A7F5681